MSDKAIPVIEAKGRTKITKLGDKVKLKVNGYPLKRSIEIKELLIKRVKAGNRSLIVEEQNQVEDINNELSDDNLSLVHIVDNYYKVEYPK